MKLQGPQLAGLVRAGATAATLALLPFIGSGPEPSGGGPVESPAKEPQAPEPAADLPPSSGSLGLLRKANAEPERDPSVCVAEMEDGFDEPATLADLVACQERVRRGHESDEAFIEGQHAEVRAYLLRHPERATTEAPSAPKGL